MHKKLSFLLLAICIGLSLQTFATDADTTQVTSLADTAQAFNVKAATQQWLSTLNGAAREKSDSYFEGGYVLQVVNLLYSLLVAFVFLKLGLGKQIKRVATKVKNVNLQNLIYIVFYFMLSWALSFPLSVYTDYFR